MYFYLVFKLEDHAEFSKMFQTKYYHKYLISLTVYQLIGFIAEMPVSVLDHLDGACHPGDHIGTTVLALWLSWKCDYISLEYRVTPGPWFNIKMTSYQYRKSHCGDKTILRPS